jgi:hypothetical protein
VLLAQKHPETFGFLKLSTYHEGSRKWRLLRSGLLGASMISKQVPGAVAGAVRLAERWHAPQLFFLYDLALDYFFWLGARLATQQLRHTPSGGMGQARSSEALWLPRAS